MLPFKHVQKLKFESNSSKNETFIMSIFHFYIEFKFPTSLIA